LLLAVVQIIVIRAAVRLTKANYLDLCFLKVLRAW
jgi:hypothetical protein